MATVRGLDALVWIARAEVRGTEIMHAMRGHKCTEACETEPYNKPLAGQGKWPACPIALTSSPAWRAVCSLYLAAQVSPLAGWPDNRPLWVVEAMMALKSELDKEEARRTKEATQRAKTGGNFRPALP